MCAQRDRILIALMTAETWGEWGPGSEAIEANGYDETGLPVNPDFVASGLARVVAAARAAAVALGWEPRRTSIPSRTRTLVYRRDGYACVDCGDDDVTRLTLDHRVPVTLAGASAPANLCTRCRSCNSRKGTGL